MAEKVTAMRLMRDFKATNPGPFEQVSDVTDPLQARATFMRKAKRFREAAEVLLRLNPETNRYEWKE
jgi:hypothetical protein